MKKQIRLIGFDDAPHNRNKKGNVLVVGVIVRGKDFLDGIVSTKVKVDGNDATKKIANIINKTKHKPQLKAIILDGIAVAGFNVIDIHELNKQTSLPVIVVIRKMPDIKNIISILKKLNQEEKINYIKKAGTPIKIKNIFVQFSGCSKEFVEEVLRISCSHSFLPEPIRLAHLIARGVTQGESVGRA